MRIFCVSSGNITNLMIPNYTEEQESEPVVDDSRFQITPFLTACPTDSGSLVERETIWMFLSSL